MKQVAGLANRMGPLLLLMTTVAALDAQQVADTNFRPPIEKPAYPEGKGPVVLIDEAHSNFHTATGRYLPFAELLRRDGYVVQASAGRFTAEVLKAGRVLVISNALNEKNQNDWKPPHLPAFTAQEVAAVRDWVAGGGSLLLIADHPPWSAAAEDLGKAFGVRFRNGVAVNPGGGATVRQGESRGVWGGGDVLGSAFRADQEPDGNERSHRQAEPAVSPERDALADRAAVRPQSECFCF